MNLLTQSWWIPDNDKWMEATDSLFDILTHFSQNHDYFSQLGRVDWHLLQLTIDTASHLNLPANNVTTLWNVSIVR